jgi:hypothetical protein
MCTITFFKACFVTDASRGTRSPNIVARRAMTKSKQTRTTTMATTRCKRTRTLVRLPTNFKCADRVGKRGHEIADRVRWVCHVIGPDQEFSPILRTPGPDFREIAKRPDTKAELLMGFLHTAHRTEDKPNTMPNPGFNDEMIGAVVSYIMSLKTRS